jgi:hypothetical protein
VPAVKDGALVERLFVVSLQQAIGDLAPEQLEVFEKWFDPTDRRPRFHIAPVIGAVGYLRKSPTLLGCTPEGCSSVVETTCRGQGESACRFEALS